MNFANVDDSNLTFKTNMKVISYNSDEYVVGCFLYDLQDSEITGHTHTHKHTIALGDMQFVAFHIKRSK